MFYCLGSNIRGKNSHRCSVQVLFGVRLVGYAGVDPTGVEPVDAGASPAGSFLMWDFFAFRQRTEAGSHSGRGAVRCPDGSALGPQVPTRPCQLPSLLSQSASKVMAPQRFASLQPPGQAGPFLMREDTQGS